LTGNVQVIRKTYRSKYFLSALDYLRYGAINNDPEKKIACKKKVKKGQTVFHYAISECLKKKERNN